MNWKFKSFLNQIASVLQKNSENPYKNTSFKRCTKVILRKFFVLFTHLEQACCNIRLNCKILRPQKVDFCLTVIKIWHRNNSLEKKGIQNKDWASRKKKSQIPAKNIISKRVHGININTNSLGYKTRRTLSFKWNMLCDCETYSCRKIKISRYRMRDKQRTFDLEKKISPGKSK